MASLTPLSQNSAVPVTLLSQWKLNFVSDNGSWLSGVIDTTESKLSNVIDTRESKLCGVKHTAELKLSGVNDTAESGKTPLSQFWKLLKDLISFKEKIKPNSSKVELNYSRPLRQNFKKWGLPEETFLNQWCHRYRWVNFEFEYLSEFEVICENTLGSETMAQGTCLIKKRRSTISWDCPFKI